MKSKSNYIQKRLWPVLVSLSSASVMLLAFFIPSIQDQWDRYQSRKIIEEYVTIGDNFFNEQNYRMAEQAFSKAFELSEGKRLDIEEKRLEAKIYLIYLDPEWGSEPPDGLKDVDFQFLLYFKKGKDNIKKRASILTCYGIYLASIGRTSEAEKVIDEALVLNPFEVLAYINKGNILDETGRKSEAEKAYVKAIELDPKNAKAHYNLGLLLSEQDKVEASEKEFLKVIELDSADSDAKMQLDLLHKRD